MRGWQVVEFGSLAAVDLPDPGPPGPGQVRLAMEAWSLNYRDRLMIAGRYDPRLIAPWIPLSDGAGRVEAVGPGVGRVAVGQRVCPTFSPSWIDGAPTRRAVRQTRGGPIPGVMAEVLVLHEDEVVVVPDHLEAVEAATLPCAGLTAHSAVVTLGQTRPGDTVAVLGSGGVSVWALQIARLCGARVLATTSSEAKAQRLTDLGASDVVLYPDDPRWGRTLRDLAGHGVHLVVEVGGAGTLAQSLAAVAVGGTVAVIGVLADTADPTPAPVLPLLMNQIRCQGVFVGPRAGLQALCRALDLHRIRPVVDRVFPFEDLPAALQHLEGGGHIGKVCLAR